MSFIVVALVFGNMEHVLLGVIMLLPLPHNPLLLIIAPFAMVAPVVVSGLIARKVRRRTLLVRADEAALKELNAPNPLRPMAPLLALPAGMLILMTFMFIPGFVKLDPAVRIAVLFVVLAATFSTFVLFSMRNAAKARTEIGQEHPVYAVTTDLARMTGVRVKQVVLVKSDTPNAYASIFGTVGVTQGLLDNFDPDEIRAVIAHEIGHLKLGHTKRQLIYGLAAMALFLTVYWFTVPQLKGKIPDLSYGLLSGPIVSFFGVTLYMRLVLGPMRRRNEIAADRFALSVVGDPELVIRALTKIHTISEQPHELKRSDEVIMAHPSLVNRIAALRGASSTQTVP